MKNNTCEITVIRHGQTIANKVGTLQGQLDTQLDDLGLLQADAVANRLKNYHFDIAYSSDLSRTMVTAKKIVAFHPNLELNPTIELREWNLGIFQGQSINELKISNPNFFNLLKKETSPSPIPGGESVVEFHNRVITFLDLIAKENLGKKVLLVSHGGVIQRMLIHTFGALAKNNIRPLCDNVSLSKFKFVDGQWQLITWNDTSHLENIEINQTIAL